MTTQPRPSLKKLIDEVVPVDPGEVDGWRCPGCDVEATATGGPWEHARDCPVGLVIDEVMADDRAWGEAHPKAKHRQRPARWEELVMTMGQTCLDPSHNVVTVTYTDDPDCRFRHIAHVQPNAVGRNDPCPCGSGRKFKHCHNKR